MIVSIGEVTESEPTSLLSSTGADCEQAIAAPASVETSWLSSAQ